MRTRPDVLVLGGGGVLGEAWMMGVLAGIEDAAGLDLRQHRRAHPGPLGEVAQRQIHGLAQRPHPRPKATVGGVRSS